MGFLSDLTNLGFSAASSALSGAINYGFGSLAQGQNYNYGTSAQNQSAQLQKDLIAHQAGLQDSYQRSLIADQYSLAKRAMQNAGFSTAAATAGGFGALANSNVNGSAQAPAFTPGNLQVSPTDLASMQNSMAQAKLMREQARGLAIENNNKQTVIDLNNALTQATTSEKNALKDLHLKESDRILKDIEKAEHEIRNIDQDTRLKAAQEFDTQASGEIRYEDLNVRTQLAIAQIKELEQKAKLDKAQAAQCYKMCSQIAEQTELLKSQGKINDKQLLLLDANIRKGKKEADLIEEFGDQKWSQEIHVLYEQGEKLKTDIMQWTQGTVEFGLPFNLFKHKSLDD